MVLARRKGTDITPLAGQAEATENQGCSALALLASVGLFAPAMLKAGSDFF
jgi:hypothetical protein